MEGPNGPSVYQQTLSSSNNTHTNSSGILPILEPHQTLSKIHTNGEASVTSDKIYDEIDELKFEIKNQAATGLVVANNKPAKSRRSSLLSKLFKFHRNPPRSSSTPNHCRLFEKLPLENPTALTPERTMEAVNDDGMENSFLELARNNSGPLRPQLRGQLYADPYNWPHDSSLDVATTALVIVDMQKDFATDQGYLAQQGIDNGPIINIIPNILKILSACRAIELPIYHTREGHRPDLSTLSSRELFRSRQSNGRGIGDQGPLGRLLVRGEVGHQIVDELTPWPNEPVIDKPGRSAFQHTEFRLMLDIKGIKNLIICGVTTDVCVTSTMREANDNNFDCVLVHDACAAGDFRNHASAVDSIKTEGGIFGSVTTVKNVLDKLEQMLDRQLNQITQGRNSELVGYIFEDGADTSHPEPVPPNPLGSISGPFTDTTQILEQELEAIHRMHGIQGMQGMQGSSVVDSSEVKNLRDKLVTRTRRTKSISGPSKTPIEKKRRESDTSSKGLKTSSGPVIGEKKLELLDDLVKINPHAKLASPASPAAASIDSAIRAVQLQRRETRGNRGKKQVPASNPLGFLKDMSMDDGSEEMPMYANGKLVESKEPED